MGRRLRDAYHALRREPYSSVICSRLGIVETSWLA
jgi:hypothetical protein